MNLENKISKQNILFDFVVVIVSVAQQ